MPDVDEPSKYFSWNATSKFYNILNIVLYNKFMIQHHRHAMRTERYSKIILILKPIINIQILLTGRH